MSEETLNDVISAFSVEGNDNKESMEAPDPVNPGGSGGGDSRNPSTGPSGEVFKRFRQQAEQVAQNAGEDDEELRNVFDRMYEAIYEGVYGEEGQQRAASLHHRVASSRYAAGLEEEPTLGAPEGMMLFNYADEAEEVPSRVLGEVADFDDVFDEYDGEVNTEEPNTEDSILRADHLMVISDQLAEEYLGELETEQESRELKDDHLNNPELDGTPWSTMDTNEDRIVDIAQDASDGEREYLLWSYDVETARDRYEED
jgi:hypothetical protein